ncbi:uncharacterized protein [Palaemon carinicauda]|uniref:uncharacterized protein n=1 Tax=Palaemon carinicauda TaxID=392227 RepID=UPI0035B6A144
MPLVYAFTRQSGVWSASQRLHLPAVTEYNCNLQHVPRKMNLIADVLSRNTLVTIHLGFGYNDLAEAQQKDSEYQACKTSCTSLHWDDVSNSTLLYDVSTCRPRQWILAPTCFQVFDFIHGFSHPYCCSTAQLMKTKFICHGTTKDVKNWVRICTSCHTSKVHLHTDSGMGIIPQPNIVLHHIHMDIVGLLPIAQGHRYLFTIIDHSTCWPEAIPMETSTFPSCTICFNLKMDTKIWYP